MGSDDLPSRLVLPFFLGVQVVGQMCWTLWLVGVPCKHQSHIVLGAWMLGKYSGQNVMQASMYNLQSLLCFMFHCCVQLERRADFPDDEVDVLFLKRHKIG